MLQTPHSFLDILASKTPTVDDDSQPASRYSPSCDSRTRENQSAELKSGVSLLSFTDHFNAAVQFNKHSG